MSSRRERRKQQTRQALIRAATALFADRGIYGTRVQDITERADIGKGAFYNYFESKDALVAELVKRGVDVLKDDYLSELNGSELLADRVETMTRSHRLFFEEHPEFALLFHQGRGLLQLKETGMTKLREVFAEYLECIGSALVPPGHASDWTADDLIHIAAAFVGGISGYRSFRIAAGLEVHQGLSERALVLGIPELMKQRARSV